MFPSALPLAVLLAGVGAGPNADAQLHEAVNQTTDEGERTGLWVERGSLGGVEISTYARGERTGPYVVLSGKGVVSITGVMLHGRENGPFALFDGDGRLRATNEYSNGQLHGRYAEFYPSGGTRREGEYQCGYRAGRWTDYDASGKQTTSIDLGYSRGKLVACEPKTAPTVVR